MNPFVRGCARVLASVGLPIVVRAERRYRQACYERPEVLAQVGGLEFALQLLRSAGVDHNATILRRLGASVGADCIIHSPLTIHNASESLANLSIGARVHLGRDIFLDLTNRIEIADAVTVSMRSVILTHMDVGRSPLALSFPRKEAPVRLGHGCYLGTGAIVLGGVTVGARAVVAAGAVVVTDVPEDAVVGGVPARPLKRLVGVD